jgi:AAA15 family ATPase/GTPase
MKNNLLFCIKTPKYAIILKDRSKMLVSFSVKNFRSLADFQEISLVASKDDSHSTTHLISTDIKNLPSVLKSAVVYGANASGKSNLIQALDFMRRVVVESGSLQSGQQFNIQPFRLNEKKLTEPSEFEITFVLSGMRYQYGFALTKERITEEWLLVYATSKAQEWFTRKYDPSAEKDVYKFGPHLKGQRKVWEEATKPNSLFLSIADQLNSEQLKPVFRWISENVNVFGPNAIPVVDYSVRMIQNDKGKQDIVNFLSAADISIKDIDVVSRKGFLNQFKLDLKDGKSEVRSEPRDILAPTFKHETEFGSATFEMEEESNGTQRLFILAGPILEILRDGKVLVVDELDSSLHPKLVRRLVSLFNSLEFNPNGAQLVFSTHDTTLLETSFLRRDQIWFAEKDQNQASHIYPLTDFSPRKNESLERGYLMGRYGAIPFFRDADLIKE